MDIHLILFLVLGCSFILSIVVGGLYLLGACLIFNHLAGPRTTERITGEKEGETRVLKTTDAGPYTAPGVDLVTTESSEPGAKRDANSIPTPSYLYCCSITLCLIVVLIFGSALFQGVLQSLGGRAQFIYNFPPLALILSFLTAVGIHSLFLQTTPLRGLVITVFVAAPWLATMLAVWAICSGR